MQLNDSSIKVILIVVILFYILALIIQVTGHRTFHIILWINAFTSLTILIQRAGRLFLVTQHLYDGWEIAFLFLECLFASITIYSLLADTSNHFLHNLKFVIFSLHLAALVGFLFLMLAFRMNRLF